jgi:serpin B
MIKDIIDELSPEARIVLMNAIYFRAVWSGKFSEENTKYEPFTAEDGQVKQVAMMHKEDAVEYTNNNIYSTIGLPYGNGKNWRMYVLLPNAGKTVADILAGLTNNSWSKNVERMYGQKIDVKLPRFKTESELGLNDVIRSLGAPTIFSGKADFSAMSSESLFVSLIKQKAAIEVSEDGTVSYNANNVWELSSGKFICLTNDFLCLCNYTNPVTWKLDYLLLPPDDLYKVLPEEDENQENYNF